VKGKEKRDRKMIEAVEKHGYSQNKVADHLGMHYSTISKIVGLPRSKT
jgi:putative transposase